MGCEGQLDNLLNDCCGYLVVYSQVTGSTELQSEVYVRLAEELIDNNIDSRPQCWRNSGEDGSDSNDESPVMMHTGRFAQASAVI